MPENRREYAEPATGRLVALVTEPINTAEVIREIQSDACGASLVFLGTTRGVTRGRRTVRLSYDCYDSMAEREIHRLIDTANDRFDVRRIAIVHRTGPVPVGEISVAIGVSAPHRAAAYECSRFLIDTLKDHVPIWKKEIFEDGTSEWIEKASP